MAERFTEWKDAHAAAQRQANQSNMDVAIRKTKEYGKTGYNVSYASRNDSDYALAEIVKPDDQPENWCSTCNVKIVRRYCNDDGSLHVCNTYGGEKI